VAGLRPLARSLACGAWMPPSCAPSSRSSRTGLT
jgi:hypothetical protein